MTISERCRVHLIPICTTLQVLHYEVNLLKLFFTYRQQLGVYTSNLMTWNMDMSLFQTKMYFCLLYLSFFLLWAFQDLQDFMLAVYTPHWCFDLSHRTVRKLEGICFIAFKRDFSRIVILMPTRLLGTDLTRWTHKPWGHLSSPHVRCCCFSRTWWHNCKNLLRVQCPWLDSKVVQYLKHSLAQ